MTIKDILFTQVQSVSSGFSELRLVDILADSGRCPPDLDKKYCPHCKESWSSWAARRKCKECWSSWAARKKEMLDKQERNEQNER
nr:MAG TPA: zinc-ribbon containing domain protein [Bacteriophage sp.]